MHLTPLLLTSGIPKMIRPAMRPDILRHSFPGYLGCPRLLLGAMGDGTTSQTTERVVWIWRGCGCGCREGPSMCLHWWIYLRGTDINCFAEETNLWSWFSQYLPYHVPDKEGGKLTSRSCHCGFLTRWSLDLVSVRKRPRRVDSASLKFPMRLMSL